MSPDSHTTHSENGPTMSPAPHPHAITRIVLRPSASPMPLGFFTVAIATCMVSALQVHILPIADRRAVAYVILPAFVLQIIVGAFALVDRDTIAATVMASFAATWLIDVLMFLADPVGAADTLALFFFIFTVFVGMMAVAARPKRALFVVLAVAVPRFFFSGLAQATGISWVSMLAGVLGFLLAAVALYTAWALLLEDVQGRTVLPIGRQGPARAAIEGDLAAQLIGIEHGAGVRRSL
jgi:succinate-acetate transporter protein